MTKRNREKLALQVFNLKMENLLLWKKKQEYGGLLWLLKQAMENEDIQLIKTLLDTWAE